MSKSKTLVTGRQPVRMPRHTAPMSFLPRKSFMTALALSFGALLVSLEVAPAHAATLDANLVDGACAAECDADTDFFPDKVTVQRATAFDVAYENHYKVLSMGDGSTLVLTQCGCERPSNTSFPAGTVFVDVPIQTTAIESTTYITFLELIGELSSMVLGPEEDDVSSPCALAQYEDETTAVGANGYYFDLLVDVDVHFTWRATAADPVTVSVLELRESDPLGAAEWVEFFALFFNREAEAKAYVDLSSARYECTSDLALERAGETGTVPKVLWASYYEGGWFPAREGAWYTDMIAKAGGELITYDVEGEAICGGFSPCLSNDQLIAGGAADADIFIYTGFNWAGFSTVPAEAAFLQTIKAVREDNVYDPQGLGSDWFESRLPEPDVVLEDLTTILQPGAISHSRVWLRHVTSDPILSRGDADDCAPFELKANQCDIVFSAADAPRASLVIAIAALAMVALVLV